MTGIRPDRFLPYGRPNLDDDDIAAVVKILKGDFLTTGPAVQSFEKVLSEQVGVSYATVCNSGTAALHLAYMAAGLSKGHQIIVPEMSFCATANAAAMCGVEVIFADVDVETGLVTEEHLNEAISKADIQRLKALVVVHLNGQTVDMAMAQKIASKYDIKLIEDACHALGSTYFIDGETFHVGACAHSDLCCFSFHPVKNIAMGEGGAVTTKSQIYKSRLDRYRNHGLETDVNKFLVLPEDADEGEAVWHREMHDLGFNYRAPDILCALASSQIRKLDAIKRERNLLVERYDQAFDKISSLSILPKLPNQAPCWHLYPIFINFSALGISRNEVIKKLKDVGIGSQVHYWPISNHPYWKSSQITIPKGANEYYSKELSLPLFSGFSYLEQDYVIEAITNIVRKA